MSKRTNSAQAQPAGKRSFQWEIRSTEISFMQIGAAEAAIDCNPAGCDCGCSSSEVRPRQRRAQRPGRTAAR